jgi:two-component system cell cycle sensor histidine kinase/response regulator CckA
VGSIFKVYLPRTSAAVEVREPVQSPKNLAGTETILLVEDSAGLRELTRALLLRQGYAVLDAADGIEALEVSKKYAGTIHLLITDIMMPRMRGTELVDHIAPERPDIPVVFLSGYTEEAMSHLKNAEHMRILEKPYTSDILLRTVRQVLDDSLLRPSVRPSD